MSGRAITGNNLWRVNGSAVHVLSVHGEYLPGHNVQDEFFYVIEGMLLIDLEGRTIELWPRQGLVVPKGIPHRARAPERTVLLIVNNAVEK